MSWHTGPLAAFDLETTSVDPETARIVSVAFIFIDEENEVMPGSFSRLADPEIAIPEEATMIHGIAQDQVESFGIERFEIISRIRESFFRCYTEEIPLVIYNARYDLTLALSEMKAFDILEGVKVPNIVDPLVIDRAVDRYRKGGRKLETVAAHYGVPLDNAHAAAADAIAAAAIARVLPLRHSRIARMPIKSLQRAQELWHEDWKMGLNKWWKKNGIDKEIPAHEVWPTHLEY